MGIDIDIDHDQEVLKFHGPSSKISKLVNAYSLASGYTCPGAKDCLSRANRKTGKIKDFGEFRCYAAMLEAVYPSLRKLVWHNTMLMKSIGDDRDKIVDLLERSLVMHKPEFISGFKGIMRPHIGGDFFSKEYAMAVNDFAWKHKDMLVYCYTKSPHFFHGESIAPNFVINVSSGGHYDYLNSYFHEAHIVYSEEEAEELGLMIDHDDTIAMNPDSGDFAILLHGSQPKGSHAQQALQLLKRNGFTGYNKKGKSKEIDYKAMITYNEVMAVTQKTKQSCLV